MTRSSKPVPGIQIACFDLCHEIGLEIISRGQGITADAVHFPVTHAHVKAGLEGIKAFADRALAAIDVAQAEWNKEMPDGR
jgi:hypothetical protein